MRTRCIALSYDKDGNPKRNVGTFYPDLGCVYTKEMFSLDRGFDNADVQNTKKRKRKRNTRSVEK